MSGFDKLKIKASRAADEIEHCCRTLAYPNVAVTDVVYRCLNEQYEKDAATIAKLEARIGKLREALGEIASDGWIEGQKVRGPFTGMTEEQIAIAALNQDEASR